jgi:sugar lactone lactonase YvrE
LFICCNNRSTLTVHPYRLRHGKIETGEGTIVAQDWLEIPDGVAVSRDGCWIAVSDHEHHRILIYRDADKTLSCQLRDDDLRHSHGLCFHPTGRSIYVADAGEREVHVYVSANGWNQSAINSAFKLAAVDPAAFHNTRNSTIERHRPLEGGIKGIDVDPSGHIIAATCHHQVLRFFEIEPVSAEKEFAIADV